VTEFTRKAEFAGLHHVTLRVTDLARSQTFYENVLGADVERLGDRLRMQLGDTVVVLRTPLEGTPRDDRFSERRIGLDHIAFRIGSEDDLKQFADRLLEAGIRTNGVELDPHGGGRFVCFRDPDNIQLEVYLDGGDP
jgi:Predicted ring-cleavage extradiol dioxygenase